MKVILSAQKYFGREVMRDLIQSGHELVAVVCPVGDRYVGELAAVNGIPIIPAGGLNYDTVPKGADLGVTAHSFDYIGKKTRYATRHGWIGYHPSLLPRHRGRSSVEWAIRFGDPVTVGTVFWLNSGIDRGDIERQDWCWVEPGETAAELWRNKLLPMGVRLIKEAVADISVGKINRAPQLHAVSTFEPSLGVKDVYKPDALMLSAKSECVGLNAQENKI